MALELWETFKASITAYTGLSPTTFFTAVALALTLYYVVSKLFGSADHDRPHQRSRDFEEEVEPLPPPVQLGEITAEELKQYDGSDAKKPLLMAIKGQIYDVSQSRMFYGPGGPYASFAGKDASRALAKMSFEEKDLTGDLTGLGVCELDTLQEWEYKFMSKYVKVGTVKATAVPVTDADPESKATDGAASSTAKPADDEAGKPAEDVLSETATKEPPVETATAAGDAEKKEGLHLTIRLESGSATLRAAYERALFTEQTERDRQSYSDRRQQGRADRGGFKRRDDRGVRGARRADIVRGGGRSRGSGPSSRVLGVESRCDRIYSVTSARVGDIFSGIVRPRGQDRVQDLLHREAEIEKVRRRE